MEQARKTLFCDPIQKSKYTGKGIGIAVLDTGIAYHPDFYTGNHYRIAAFKDFVNHSKCPMMITATERMSAEFALATGSCPKVCTPVLHRKAI